MPVGDARPSARRRARARHHGDRARVGPTGTGREYALAAISEPIPPDVDDCATAYSALAGSYGMEGNVTEAVAVSRRGLALAEARGAPEWVLATSLAVAAMHQLGNGLVAEGRADAERAVDLARRTRVPSCLVLATYALGWALAFDEFERAEAVLGETIELCRAGAIDAVLAPALCLRANLAYRDGRLTTAVADLRAGFDRSVEIADALTIAASSWSVLPVFVLGGMAEAAGVVLGALDAGVIWSYLASGFGIFGEAQIGPTLEAAAGSDRYAAAHAIGAAMTYDEAIAFLRSSLEALAVEVAAEPE